MTDSDKGHLPDDDAYANKMFADAMQSAKRTHWLYRPREQLRKAIGKPEIRQRLENLLDAWVKEGPGDIETYQVPEKSWSLPKCVAFVTALHDSTRPAKDWIWKDGRGRKGRDLKKDFTTADAKSLKAGVAFVTIRNAMLQRGWREANTATRNAVTKLIKDLVDGEFKPSCLAGETELTDPIACADIARQLKTHNVVIRGGRSDHVGEYLESQGVKAAKIGSKRYVEREDAEKAIYPYSRKVAAWIRNRGNDVGND